MDHHDGNSPDHTLYENSKSAGQGGTISLSCLIDKVSIVNYT